MKKIVHIMLTGPVTDGWNYQDNLLTKYHRKAGNEVTMITSEWIWGENGELAKCEKSGYRNENDVRVIRLRMRGKDKWGRKFERFEGLKQALEEEKPDVLFLHGVGFMDVDVILGYLKRRRRQDGKDALTVYADNHSDLSNSGTNWISRNLLHKIIWKRNAQKLNPYVKQFFGVLPARVDWLVKMYGLPREKCGLLVLGADDELVQKAYASGAGDKIREKYGIAKEDFLIVTGGKIDRAKRQTLYLMEAVRQLQEEKAREPEGRENVRLLVFGSVEKELEPQVRGLTDNAAVLYAGWVDAADSYHYFAAADLAVFPGRHSVFWEQVVGMGKPMVCKYWEGTTHVDIGGNVVFLHQDGVQEIKAVLEDILKDGRKKYYDMCRIAGGGGRKQFSYEAAAARCSGS